MKDLNKAGRCFSMKKVMMLLFLILGIGLVSGAIQDVTVDVLGEKNYSDIWLGISTGGYKLIAEKGEDFIFDVYIKNGMNEKSLHNVEIAPTEDFPFKVNEITPKSIEQLKPMEIRRYLVNISIGADVANGKYPIKFDVLSLEFPRGVFSMNEEIEIVRHIKWWIYILYGLASLLILAILIYRKIKMGKRKYD